MNSSKVKVFLHLIVSIVVSFLLIYLLVFVGGWKLIESGDPILWEVAVSVILGFVMWVIFELAKFYECKIKKLEQRVDELEKKFDDDLNSK